MALKECEKEKGATSCLWCRYVNVCDAGKKFKREYKEKIYGG